MGRCPVAATTGCRNCDSRDWIASERNERGPASRLSVNQRRHSPRFDPVALERALEVLNLYAVLLQRVADLAWRQAEDACGLGLDPAGFLHRGDEPVALRQLPPICFRGAHGLWSLFGLLGGGPTLG